MEFTGTIIAILEPRSGVSPKNGNSWKIQEYVIQTVEQYPKSMCFEVFGEDKINLFNIQLNQQYKISFDIDAHEHNGRWYNQLRAWKSEPLTAPAPAAPQQSQQQTDPFAQQDNESGLLF